MGKKNISRRKFLGQASCAAIGSTAFLSTAINLGMINTISARPHIIENSDDYKAMVCILLAGGCDTHNVLVPTENVPYAEYQSVRGDLALDRNDPSQLAALATDGDDFALHGGMTKVRDMFNAGELSFIANIGTLIEPIQNRAEFESGMKKLPLGLYSHSDQIMHWQTSVPQSRSAVGVGGRMADILNDMNSIPNISMNISLSGKNQFQAGNLYNEYSMSRKTTAQNIGLDGFPSYWSSQGLMNDLKSNAIKNLAEQEYSNIFHNTIGDLTNQTQASIETFETALSNVEPFNNNMAFSDTNISNDLKKIAEVIQVRNFLGANRQIFFVSFGGWDHHDNVLLDQGIMLPQLSNALGEFNAAMKEINRHNDVITFTISDFARTLTTNGNGSDHAWGGNQMVMGGPITGKKIFGTYPSLDLNSDFNVSNRGRMLPTTSVDEFYAELALWFGASPNDLSYILPNICNFYSPTCPSPVPNDYMPIGMFS